MYIILCTYIIIHMQANRQIQNYQAFVLFKKRKTARASGLIRRTPAFFSAIFLVRLLHAPISRAVRRKTAAATEIVRPSGDKIHRPPRARVKVGASNGSPSAFTATSTRSPSAARSKMILPVRQQHRCGKPPWHSAGLPRRAAASRAIYSVSPFSLRHAPARGAAPRRRPPCRPPDAPLAAVINRRARRACRTIARTTGTDALCSLRSWPRALHRGYPAKDSRGSALIQRPRLRAELPRPGCGQSQTGSWS